MLYIFVLELENDKWFLHVSHKDNYNHIELECQTLYSFVRKNPPLKKHEVLQTFNKFEINTLTKKYMEYYGIDNVRGGIYSDEIFPDYLIKSLELELSTTFDNYTKKTGIFYNIRNKPNLTLEDFDNKMIAYNEIIDKGYQEISREFFIDLEWLENKILCFEQSETTDLRRTIFNKEDDARYKNLLEKMEVVRTKYFQLEDDKIKVEVTPLLSYPKFIFDFFMYHRSLDKDWEKERDTAVDILKKYEFMGYTLLNIIECMEFDFNNPVE